MVQRDISISDLDSRQKHSKTYAFPNKNTSVDMKGNISPQAQV